MPKDDDAHDEDEKMIPLKQSTAFTWKAGPFTDDTDGKTAETALTIAQADIRITKAGGDYAQSHNSAGATHDESGNYNVPLDATDTDTLGPMRVMIQMSGALPVWDDFIVLTEKAYNALTGAGNSEVDVVLWNGSGLPTIPSAAPTVGEIRTELATELGRVDVAISSRLATSGYVAPDNAGIAALPTAEAIDTQLSGVHGSGAWGSVAVTEHHAPAADDPILDENGNPVQGAEIYAYSDSDYGTLVAKATTDANGLWDLYFAASGTYYIRCVMAGYEDEYWTEVVS